MVDSSLGDPRRCLDLLVDRIDAGQPINPALLEGAVLAQIAIGQMDQAAQTAKALAATGAAVEVTFYDAEFDDEDDTESDAESRDDWRDARNVPLEAGKFDLDDYIDYLIGWMEHIGPGAHMLAVCQPSVPALAAAAIMAGDDSTTSPSSSSPSPISTWPL